MCGACACGCDGTWWVVQFVCRHLLIARKSRPRHLTPENVVVPRKPATSCVLLLRSPPRVLENVLSRSARRFARFRHRFRPNTESFFEVMSHRTTRHRQFGDEIAVFPPRAAPPAPSPETANKSNAWLSDSARRTSRAGSNAISWPAISCSAQVGRRRARSGFVAGRQVDGSPCTVSCSPASPGVGCAPAISAPYACDTKIVIKPWTCAIRSVPISVICWVRRIPGRFAAVRRRRRARAVPTAVLTR